MEVYLIYLRAHRTNVDEVDVLGPSDVASCIDARDYQKCRFDVTISGEGFTSLTVQPVFWSEETQSWIETSESQSFNALGEFALMVDGSGGYVNLGLLYLKVTAFVGTSFCLTAKYVLG